MEWLDIFWIPTDFFHSAINYGHSPIELPFFFFFLMVKMSFRNVFSIFKSEVTNCGPQPTVLNIKKLAYIPAFQDSWFVSFSYKSDPGDVFTIVAVSSQVVTGFQLKEASSFLCPLSSTPVFFVLIHITHISHLGEGSPGPHWALGLQLLLSTVGIKHTVVAQKGLFMAFQVHLENYWVFHCLPPSPSGFDSCEH